MWTTDHSDAGVPILCCRSNLGRDILCCTPSWPSPSRENTHRVSSCPSRCVVARHFAAPFACSSRKHCSSAAALGSVLERASPRPCPGANNSSKSSSSAAPWSSMRPRKGLHHMIGAGREPIWHGNEHGLIDLPTEERIPQCLRGDTGRERPEQDAGAVPAAGHRRRRHHSGGLPLSAARADPHSRVHSYGHVVGLQTAKVRRQAFLS